MSNRSSILVIGILIIILPVGIQLKIEYNQFKHENKIESEYIFSLTCSDEDESRRITTTKYGDLLRACGTRSLSYDAEGNLSYVFSGIFEYNSKLLKTVNLLNLRADPANYNVTDGSVQMQLPRYYYYDDSVSQEIINRVQIYIVSDTFDFSDFFEDGWNTALMQLKFSFTFYGNHSRSSELQNQEINFPLFSYYVMDYQYNGKMDGLKPSIKSITTTWDDLYFTFPNILDEFIDTSGFRIIIFTGSITLIGLVSIYLIDMSEKKNEIINLKNEMRKIAREEIRIDKSKVTNAHSIKIEKRNQKSNPRWWKQYSLIDDFEGFE